MTHTLSISLQYLDQYKNPSYKPYLAIDSKGDAFITYEDRGNGDSKRFYTKTPVGNIYDPGVLETTIKNEIDNTNDSHELQRAKQTGLAKLSSLEKKALGLK